MKVEMCSDCDRRMEYVRNENRYICPHCGHDKNYSPGWLTNGMPRRTPMEFERMFGKPGRRTTRHQFENS